MNREDGRCPFCGNALTPSSPICPSCGRNIFQPYTGHSEGDKLSRRPPSIALTSKNLIIGVVIVVLIALAPIIAYLNFNKSNQASPGSTAQTNTSHVAPTQFPNVTSTPTSSQASGVVPCQSDWSGGMNGWVGSSEWKVVDGKLLSDGTNAGYNVAPAGSDSVMSPCQLSATNYAVEAKMQILDTPTNCYLAIRARVQPDGSEYDGYFVGYDSYFGDANISFFSPNAGFSSIKSTIYSPGLSEHLYRAELKDNQITLKIDGSVVLQVSDNRFINTGQVGLESGGCQVSVSSFAVMAL